MKPTLKKRGRPPLKHGRSPKIVKRSRGRPRIERPKIARTITPDTKFKLTRLVVNNGHTTAIPLKTTITGISAFGIFHEEKKVPEGSIFSYSYIVVVGAGVVNCKPEDIYTLRKVFKTAGVKLIPRRGNKVGSRVSWHYQIVK